MHCKFLGYLSIRWIVIYCVAYLLTLQDDPLLFDYNVQDRVNDFVAVSFSQVWLRTNFHVCLSFPSKALLKLGCIYCYQLCICFSLYGSEQNHFILESISYYFGLNIQQVWVCFFLIIGKCYKIKSHYVHNGHRFQVPICQIMVQAAR